MKLELSVLVEGSGFPHLRASILLVETKLHRWLIDCGARVDRSELVRALDRRNVEPRSIDGLLFTHLHGDHCENAELFPSATVYVHEREWEDVESFAPLETEKEAIEWVRSHYAVIHPVFQRSFARWVVGGGGRELLRIERPRLLSGTTTVDDGVVMVDSPGHSRGHMSVRVSGRADVWIAGDILISEAEYRAGTSAAASRVCWNPAAAERSVEIFRSHKGWIIPGHGPPFLARRSSAERPRSITKNVWY